MNLKIINLAIFLGWLLPATALALTAEEILLLKQNGVSEKTIQMMLQSEIEARREEAKDDGMGIKTIIRPGGRPAIVYSTGRDDHAQHQAEERLKEARAWEMLQHIIVDTRKTEN